VSNFPDDDIAVDDQNNGSHHVDAQAFIPLWVQPSSDGPGVGESKEEKEDSPGDGDHSLTILAAGWPNPARMAIQRMPIKHVMNSCARLTNQILRNPILWLQLTLISRQSNKTPLAETIPMIPMMKRKSWVPLFIVLAT